MSTTLSGEAMDSVLERHDGGGPMAATVPDQAIDELYEDLLRLKKEADFDLVLRMGKLILDRLHAGDKLAFQAQGAKDGSLRKLAAKFKAEGVEGMSATWLFRTVQTHLINIEHGVSARKHLTPRHAVAVIGLPAQRQASLLDDAENEGLTTRELEVRAAEVRKVVRKETGETRGRPRDPSFVKSLNHLRRCFVDDVDVAFGDLEELEDLDRSRIEGLRQVASAGKHKLAELETLLDARLRDLEGGIRRRRG